MAEKEEIILKPEEIEELKVKTHFPIWEPFKNFYRRIITGTGKFVDYKIPAARDNFKSWITSFRGGIILFCFGFSLIFPLILNTAEYYHLFIVAMIYSIYAASWDLLAGVTGQVSFGHAAFLGIGGYAFAWLLGFQINWVLAIFIAAILTVLVGLIIAIPSLRLKGPYLALGTLAFSLLFYYLLQYPELNIDQLELPLTLDFWYRSNILREFFIIFAFMTISVVIMLVIYNSRLGKIFQGIRDDEYATQASGINITKYKLFSFMISSFFAGLAGVLFTLRRGLVTFFSFSTTLSFYPVVFTCLGGIASISGAVMGAYTFTLLTKAISEIFSLFLPSELQIYFETIAAFIFAIILLIIIRFTERGIMEPAIKHTKTLWDILLGK
ncbi:MAG: branched-chain amino acid ABC transporter permease [Promethearchaeota archaeon]